MAGTHPHPHPRPQTESERETNRKRLTATLLLSAGYMVAEVVGGVLANSLALLADAGHMLSDVAALGLALFAVWFARRPPTVRHTYGFYRTEILAALANGAALIAVSILIFVEAYQRLRHPPEVRGTLMMAIAAGGLVINLVSLWILKGGRQGSLNVRGVWLHVLTDAFGSLQAIIAGALILGFGWSWADPLASLLIGALVVYSSWGLLKESVAVLMEGVPVHIDVDEVKNAIIATPGVTDVCDLHIWTISSGMESLSAHIVVDGGQSHQVLLRKIRDTLCDRFGICHMTIQLEPADFHEPDVWF
ncbi:MAG: cation diffusion facilitator family transporter [bacterium]